MSDVNNYKGQLQTFCAQHLFSAPKYKSEQIEQTGEWKSECMVKIDNDTYKTIETKPRKKEAEAMAAKKMYTKLHDKSILSPDVLLNIKHTKHLKKLRKDKSNKLQYLLATLESLFSDEQISNSMVMQKLIESSNDEWISLDHLLKMSIFQDTFGEFGWNHQQYKKSKNILIDIIKTKSEILELSEDTMFIRRKKLFENIPKSEDLKQKLKKDGNDLFKQNKYDQAVNKYLEALKYDKSDYKILMNLSLVYLKMKDNENALKFARKAIISKPCLSKPYARTAMVYYEMGKINQAIATINNAIVLQPKNEEYKQLLSNWVSNEK